MPTKAPTGCAEPGCIYARPCPLHPRGWSEGGRGRKMPPGWDATRARILRRDPLCRGCWSAPSTEVHHTVPGVETDELLAGLCHDCHAAITAAQALAARGLGLPPGPLPERGPRGQEGTPGWLQPPGEPGGQRPAQGRGSRARAAGATRTGGGAPPRPGASGSISCPGATRRRFRPFPPSPPATGGIQAATRAASGPVLVLRPRLRPDRG